MSMWIRFKRMISSIFGGAMSAMENPKLILEQNIRELNDQVPKMNETIAQVKAAVIQHEKALKKSQGMEKALINKIKVAIRAGRQEIAREYALRLERTRAEIQATSEQLQQANMAFEKAKQVKEVFMRERERKISEARAAIRAHDRAKMQSKVAGALEQFEVADTSQTHDEMIRRIEEETAREEARMEVALDSVDVESLELEQEAEAYHADEIIQQIEMEMLEAGQLPPKSVEASASSGGDQAQRTADSKTVGLDNPGSGRAPSTRTT